MEITSSPISRKDTRETKYCRDIRAYLNAHGHATNTQILAALREHYPNLSATTVHRATTRLADRGEICAAPPDTSGAMRYDSNTHVHDHFMCRSCGQLRDTNVGAIVREHLESSLSDCHISGPITISGLCKNCSSVKFAI